MEWLIVRGGWSCAAAVAITMWGCGDPGGTTSSGSGGQTGTDGGSGDADDAPGSGGQSGTGDSGESTDDTADSDTGSAASCEPSGDLLYPLEVGRSWTFEQFVGGECGDMDWTVSVTGTEEIGESTAFVIEEGCALAQFTSHLRQTGQTVERYNDATMTWLPIIEAPIENGHAWGGLHWEEAGSVAVAAGEFDDCWDAVSDGPEGGTRTTYCAGVGVVQSKGFELSSELATCTTP